MIPRHCYFAAFSGFVLAVQEVQPGVHSRGVVVLLLLVPLNDRLLLGNVVGYSDSVLGSSRLLPRFQVQDTASVWAGIQAWHPRADYYGGFLSDVAVSAYHNNFFHSQGNGTGEVSSLYVLSCDRSNDLVF